MEKTSATVLVLLKLAVTLVWCQPNAGTCNTAAVAQYVVGNLDANCAISLNTVSSANVSVSARDAALATACTESCAGRLANWLLNDCSSRFNSTILYYVCQQTGGSATVGRYCYYSTPPQFDANATISTLLQACQAVIQQPQQCTDQCAMQLQNFADQLGCCYQSIYNNTEFLQEASQIGELSSQDVSGLQQIVGNLMLWSACSVIPPGRCTESFAFPMIDGRVTTGGSVTTDGSVMVLSQVTMLAALVLTAAAIILFA